MIDPEDTTTPEEVVAPIEVVITNHDKIKAKALSQSFDETSPYDEMDISIEEIASYMEDINAQ